MPFLRSVVNRAGQALSNRAAKVLRDSDKVGEGGGGEFKTIWLPGSRFLNQYNILNNNNLFWITLRPKIVGTPKIKRSTSGTGKKDLFLPDPKALEVFKILYSDESYSQSHSHTWEKSKIQEKLDSLAKIANGQTANMIANVASKTYSSLTENRKTNNAPSESLLEGVSSALISSIGARDQYIAASVLDFYANSATVPIEVKFNLIAYDNPILDIILPIKRLVSLTYPQAINIVSQKKIARAIGTLNKSNELSGDEGDNNLLKLENARQAYAKISKEMTDMEGEKTSADLNANAEKIVMHKGNPPVLWDIDLSNDLQFMKNAYCKSVNVQYFGPWMGKPDQTTVFKGLFGNIHKTLGAGLFGAILNPSSVRQLLNKGDPNGKGGYPSYATVSMTFEPALTQTAGDILALDSSDLSVNSKGDLTNTSVGGPLGIEAAINKPLKFIKNRFGGDVQPF